MSPTVAVIIQCRLSSTRLQEKALMPLAAGPLFSYTLRAMKKVKANYYILATDEKSKEKLTPEAKSLGYLVVSGPLDDVLKRYCIAIERVNCDIVVRATCDNPFLFFDAAQDLLNDFIKTQADYMTYEGLPHGSGVEVFRASSLLQAEKETQDPYDREHVGPALYRHGERFKSIFTRAQKKYYFPNIRTTVDTLHDLRIAETLEKRLLKAGATWPYKSSDIITYGEGARAVLLIPSLSSGTGHFTRCKKWASECGYFLYDGEPIQKGEFDLIIVDLFYGDEALSKKLSYLSPVLSLDDGCKEAAKVCDITLSIIPSLTQYENNLIAPQFMIKPSNKSKHNCPLSFLRKKDIKNSDIKVLVAFGGGLSPLTDPVAKWFLEKGFSVFVINGSSSLKSLDSSDRLKNLPYVPNLADTLSDYDIVATHYGITAYEAVSAGALPILSAPTKLHKKLQKFYNFPTMEVLKKRGLGYCVKSFQSFLSKHPKIKLDEEDFETYVDLIASGRRYNCPVCGGAGAVLARTPHKTYRLCPKCRLTYLSFVADKKTSYNEDYFMDSYRAQYGKTYLEDFSHIESLARGRLSHINKCLGRRGLIEGERKLLDIGCAYGPFLSAAKAMGFIPVGVDIAQSAIDYVKGVLGLRAYLCDFSLDDELGKLPFSGDERFKVITMWFVIEHFSNLDFVLKRVASLLKSGGVFAFSTPNGMGVSASFNRRAFFSNSPCDHYSIFNKRSVQKVLDHYGFKVKKFISTGHHPKRFPIRAPKVLLKFISKFFFLGDTFEVYAVKK